MRGTLDLASSFLGLMLLRLHISSTSGIECSKEFGTRISHLKKAFRLIR